MGTQLPLCQRVTAPQFSAHICCGQMAAWIKMSPDMELGLGPGDFVLDGDPAPHSPKGAEPPPQKKKFGPCLLWPDGWMDQGGNWHWGRPQPRGLCVRWGPSPLPKKGVEPPIFGPCILWPNCWMDQDSTWHGGRRWSRPHCARWGPSSPP